MRWPWRRYQAVSRTWLRQQEQREALIHFEGPAWNWSYLIQQARRQRFRWRQAGQSRRVA